MVQEEDCNLFVRLLANIHSAVNAASRLVPAHLPRRNLQAMTLTSVAVFDSEGITGQDHGDR